MFLILFLYGPFTPKAVDMQSVHDCGFLETSIYFDLLFAVHVKNYTCKYHDIGRCGDHMYVMR